MFDWLYDMLDTLLDLHYKDVRGEPIKNGNWITINYEHRFRVFVFTADYSVLSIAHYLYLSS